MKIHEFLKRSCLLLFLTILPAGQGVASQNLLEARLQQACVTLQQTPLDLSGLQILAEVSRTTTISPSLRSLAMEAYAAALLIQGNTNAFSQAVQIQKTMFPDQPSSITIGKNDYLFTCTDCLGKGEKNTTCPLCRGSGKCKPCDGTGKTADAAGSTIRCPSCTRPGICNMCNGKKNTERTCPTCLGTGKIFKLSAAVRKNYRDLLSDIEGVCQENSDYAERLKKAELEKEVDTRIRLLQALTNSFPHRADLTQANVLLSDAVAKRETRLRTLQEQEARTRSEREVGELRKRVETESPENAIAALRTYLTEHPDTPALKDLQPVLDGLTYQQERKKKTHKILIVLATFVSIVLLFLFVQPFWQRKRVQGIEPLPGMRNIDKNKFTDPLSLTASDSRSRVKNKTSKIPFPKKKNGQS